MRCLYENPKTDNFHRIIISKTNAIQVRSSTLNFFHVYLFQTFPVGSRDECMEARLPTFHQTYSSHISNNIFRQNLVPSTLGSLTFNTSKINLYRSIT